MNIKLLTFYSPEWQPLADIVMKNKNDYCRRHGYDHLIYIGSYGDLGYYAYQRLEFLKDFLSCNRTTDYVLVANLHSVFVNQEKKIEDVIKSPTDEFFITRDCHGFNAGIFIVKNTEGLWAWLDSLIAAEPHFRHHVWHEQKAIQNSLAGAPNLFYNIVPQAILNGYDYTHYGRAAESEGQWNKDSLIFHAPGRSMKYNNGSLLQSRIEFLTDFLNANQL